MPSLIHQSVDNNGAMNRKKNNAFFPYKTGKLLETDVVCGMNVDEKTSKWKSEYKSKTYHFCGLICKLEFDEDPEKYMSNAKSILDK